MQPSTINGAVAKPYSSAPNKRGDDHIPPSFHLAVGFDPDAATQIVQHERLMCLRQSQLPWNACILNGGERRCPRTAGISANQNFIGVSLRNTRRDGPNPDFRHKLNGHGGIRIRVFQIEDELGQVLNGIDIMVRRRGNQLNSRRGIPNLAINSSTLFPVIGRLRQVSLLEPS